MRREPIALALGLSLVAVAIVVVAAALPVPGPPGAAFTLIMGLLFGGMVGAAILLALLFLPSFRIGVIPMAPDRAVADLAHRLRLAQRRVAEKPGELRVHVGGGGATKILVRPSPEGSEISYRADATTPAWGTLITLIVLAWTSFAAVPAAVYVFWRSWRFARRDIAQLLALAPTAPVVSRADEIRDMVIGGLAEAHRLASEAYEAEREGYSNTQALVAFGAFLLWFLSFLGFVLLTAASDGLARIPSTLVLATVVAVGFAAPLAWIVRRRARPRLLRYRAWTDKLRGAWRREAARRMPDAGEPSAFELLAEASKEVPTWLEAVRRAGMGRDPGAFFLVFLMGLWAFQLLAVGVPGLVTADPGIGALLLGGGTLLTVGAVAFYLRWKSRRDEALARERQEWDRRFLSIRARMEEFLQGL